MFAKNNWKIMDKILKFDFIIPKLKFDLNK